MWKWLSMRSTYKWSVHIIHHFTHVSEHIPKSKISSSKHAEGNHLILSGVSALLVSSDMRVDWGCLQHVVMMHCGERVHQLLHLLHLLTVATVNKTMFYYVEDPMCCLSIVCLLFITPLSNILVTWRRPVHNWVWARLSLVSGYWYQSIMTCYKPSQWAMIWLPLATSIGSNPDSPQGCSAWDREREWEWMSHATVSNISYFHDYPMRTVYIQAACKFIIDYKGLHIIVCLMGKAVGCMCSKPCAAHFELYLRQLYIITFHMIIYYPK